MRINLNLKLAILIAVVILSGALYLFLGINFDIIQYQLPARMKKLILMFIVGGAIAASVVIFQAITTNRLLTPSIMGLDAVYMFIKVLLVFIFGAQSLFNTNIYLNFGITVLAMISFALILFQGIFRLKNVSVYFILLVGIIMGTFFRSITSFLELIIDPEDFLAVQSAMFANFNAANPRLMTLSAIILLILIGLTFYLIPYLDVLLLGRAQAINLGVPYQWMTRTLLIMVAVLVSLSTALVGPIAFLGLMTVNIAHELMRTYEHKYIFPATLCLSWISLFIAQSVLEHIFDATTQVSIVIDLIGGLYFIYLLVKRRNTV